MLRRRSAGRLPLAVMTTGWSTASTATMRVPVVVNVLVDVTSPAVSMTSSVPDASNVSPSAARAAVWTMLERPTVAPVSSKANPASRISNDPAGPAACHAPTWFERSAESPTASTVPSVLKV